ncbi:MAG: hypothetical protein JXB39_14175 [Deltaproteobacteria bacterium]|nr:hypothetical protein [Deltaproteobacteria bacterium]
MKGHLSDDLLERFDTGRLSRAEAARVAVHLDACSPCAGRAHALDPLASVFSAVEDPPVPEGLERAILEAAARPPRTEMDLAWPVAGALLAAAAVLFVSGGDPTGLATAGARIAGAALLVGDVVTGLCSPVFLLFVCATTGLVSSVAAFGLLGLSREVS